MAAPSIVILKPKIWDRTPPRMDPTTPAAPIIELIRLAAVALSGFSSTTLRVERAHIEKRLGAGNDEHPGDDVNI
jgi:hypothetical protein